MAIKLHEAPEVTQNDIRTRSNDRDEFQQAIDKDVSALKEAWEKNRKPAPGPKAPYHRYVIEKDDRAELKNVIRRACRLYQVAAVFFTDVATGNGLYQVKFNLQPMPKKEEAKEETAEGTE
jgi:hypothetical protein